MTGPVLLDTGPLVAALNRRDRFHPWARSMLGVIRPPLHTCEAVLAEACFLLRGGQGGADAVLALVERGILAVEFPVSEHTASIRRLMGKYRDVPMSLADACLVRMSELHDGATLWTLDNDFRVYRRHRRQTIPLLMPSEM